MTFDLDEYSENRIIPSDLSKLLVSDCNSKLLRFKKRRRKGKHPQLLFYRGTGQKLLSVVTPTSVDGYTWHQ